MHCMLLGYSFKPSPNSLAFGTSDPVMTIGLSISNARTRKTSSTRENMADWSRSMSCADLKGLAPFRQGLLFSSSMKKKTKESSARTVSYRLYFKVADPGEWPGGGGGGKCPLFLENFFWETAAPHLSKGLDDRPLLISRGGSGTALTGLCMPRSLRDPAVWIMRACAPS